MGNIEAFHDIMAQFSNLTGGEDNVWKIGNEGVFSVKAAYKDLDHSDDRMEFWTSGHGR